jgi:hypothetical protein
LLQVLQVFGFAVTALIVVALVAVAISALKEEHRDTPKKSLEILHLL